MNSLLIAENIIKRAFRNKIELFILTLLPIIIIGLMTTITSEHKDEIPSVGYINLDTGDMGAILIDYLNGQEDVNLISINADDLLNNENISFSISIPKDFTEKIREVQPTNITFFTKEPSLIYENLKDKVNQYVASLYVLNNYDTEFNNFIASLESPLLTLSYYVVGNERNGVGKKYEDNLPSMGFIITFIMLLVFFTIGTVIEDKKRMTLARIYSNPVKEWQVITGNVLGSFALGLIQLIPILITLKIVFNIPWGQQFIGLTFTLLTLLLTTIGLGIGLAGVIKDFNPMLLISIVIIPTSILGGAFIPPSMLPDVVNKIAYIVPQKWVMNSLEKVFQGEPISAILINLGVILMFGLAFATFGTKTLKPLNE